MPESALTNILFDAAFEAVRSVGYDIPEIDMKALEQCISQEKAFDRTVWGLLSIEFWFQNFFDG